MSVISDICLSSGPVLIHWLFSALWVIFFLCMPNIFLLDANILNFIFLGLKFLYFYKYSWALFKDTVKYLETFWVFIFKYFFRWHQSQVWSSVVSHYIGETLLNSLCHVLRIMNFQSSLLEQVLSLALIIIFSNLFRWSSPYLQIVYLHGYSN